MPSRPEQQVGELIAALKGEERGLSDRQMLQSEHPHTLTISDAVRTPQRSVRQLGLRLEYLVKHHGVPERHGHRSQESAVDILGTACKSRHNGSALDFSLEGTAWATLPPDVVSHDQERPGWRRHPSWDEARLRQKIRNFARRRRQRYGLKECLCNECRRRRAKLPTQVGLSYGLKDPSEKGSRQHVDCTDFVELQWLAMDELLAADGQISDKNKEYLRQVRLQTQ